MPRPHATVRFAGLLIVWLVLMLVGWGLGELSVAVARRADIDAVRDVASDRSGLLTALAHALSFIGSGYVIIPLTIVIVVILYARGDRLDAYAIALSLSGAMALSSLVKVIVHRARPPVHHLEAVTSASFPSGHATQSTALLVALLLAWLAPRPARGRAVAATLATLLLIAAIAMSRVYLGVHYPTDVVAGITLGAAWSVFTRRVLVASTEFAGRWPFARPSRSA